jgi:hypothetical protein
MVLLFIYFGNINLNTLSTKEEIIPLNIYDILLLT